MAAHRTLPGWAVATARILLVAQGLIAAPVAIIAIALRIATRYCYTDSFCELNDIVLGLLALMTLGFAGGGHSRTLQTSTPGRGSTSMSTSAAAPS